MSIFDWTPNNLRGDIETASRLVDGEPFRGSIRKGTLVLISQRRLRRLLEAAKKAADPAGGDFGMSHLERVEREARARAADHNGADE